MTPLTQILADLKRDPEFRAEYARLEPELFAIQVSLREVNNRLTAIESLLRGRWQAEKNRAVSQ